jgi:hypothetical protein
MLTKIGTAIQGIHALWLAAVAIVGSAIVGAGAMKATTDYREIPTKVEINQQAISELRSVFDSLAGELGGRIDSVSRNVGEVETRLAQLLCFEVADRSDTVEWHTCLIVDKDSDTF